MPDPETVIESTMREHCDVCKEPGKYELRLATVEDNYEELKKSLKEYKQQTYDKFDRLNTRLVATLTTALISLLLLIINLIIIYGGR